MALSDLYEIPAYLSLGVIVAALAATVAVSLLRPPARRTVAVDEPDARDGVADPARVRVPAASEGGE
jgi:hypothetical protein